jgi:hypothetical protein
MFTKTFTLFVKFNFCGKPGLKQFLFFEVFKVSLLAIHSVPIVNITSHNQFKLLEFDFSVFFKVFVVDLGVVVVAVIVIDGGGR